jgi:hypothetical protein
VIPEMKVLLQQRYIYIIGSVIRKLPFNEGVSPTKHLEKGHTTCRFSTSPYG